MVDKGFRSDQEITKAMCDLMVEHGKWTEEEGNSWYVKLCAQDVRAKQRHADNVRREVNTQNGENPTQMITFALHQGLTEEEAIKAQRNIVASIKKANYKWLINAQIKFEYYSAEKKWNPHVHLLVDKTTRVSQVRQQIYRKFMEGKKAEPNVYNTDVTECKDDSQRNYLKGNKQEAKLENVLLDIEFREKYDIEEIMTI